MFDVFSISTLNKITNKNEYNYISNRLEQPPPLLQSINCSDTSNNETRTINIQSRNQLLRLNDLLNGSVKIEFEEIPANHVLLTFVNDQSNKNATIDEIDCWSTVNDSMIVTNLSQNETQTYCLMEKEAKTVSPLDCLSILPRNMDIEQDSDQDSAWLTEDDKALAIGLLVAGLILCLVFGFGIGMLIVKRLAQNQIKESRFTRPDLISSDWNHDNKNEDIGYPYTDNDTMSIASDQGNYVAAVNPSRFDLIKMRLDKAENPVPCDSENLYGLEDMPNLKVIGLFK